MGTGRSWLLHLPLNNVIQQMQVAPGCFPVQGGKLGTELTWDTGTSLSETVPSTGSLSHPQPSQWHAKHSPDSPCAGRGNSCRGPSAASGAGTAPRVGPGSKFKLVLCVFVHASAGSSPHSPTTSPAARSRQRPRGAPAGWDLGKGGSTAGQEGERQLGEQHHGACFSPG